MSDHPEWVYAAALCALPLQTPARVRTLMRAGPGAQVFAAICTRGGKVDGIDPELLSVWRRHVDTDLPGLQDQYLNAGVRVLTERDVEYPWPLRGDKAAPAVVFVKGSLGVLDHRRVAIIGTRRASNAGRHFARELGTSLAERDVCVVSGLARGIDGEGHRGALAVNRSPRNALAVVASGIDVVYPPEHGDLWQSVATHGLLLSETPLGARPEAHRFPMRNRILAALSEVVVVVESAATGGSMSTVREAERRGVDVMAVPGRPGVRTSEGTNGLLRDGCAPVTSAEDVFVALGLDTRKSRPTSDVRPAPVGIERCVVAALTNQPGTIDSLSLATALSVVDIALALGRLESAGWVSQTGAWWELLPSVHSG